MKKQACLVGLVVAGMLAAIPNVYSKRSQAAFGSKADEQTTREIEANMRSRFAALDRSDPAAYAVHVDPAAILAEPGEVGTGAERIADVKPTVGYKIVLEHDSPKVTRFGDTALAVYHQNEKEVFGDQHLDRLWTIVDTYIRRDGRWLMVAHVATPNLLLRKPGAAKSADLKQFVGEYQWGPGYVDTVTLVNGKLMTSWTGDPAPAEWHALNENAFFLDKDPYEAIVTFKKDASGKVTQYVYESRGQEIIAKKIK